VQREAGEGGASPYSSDAPPLAILLDELLASDGLAELLDRKYEELYESGAELERKLNEVRWTLQQVNHLRGLKLLTNLVEKGADG
jgi:hypothetical protein